ncbi:hypothetical protein EDC01DRAFT_783464 [Geopyxis carbonaria]|nr:hypothetical protein EDC01DRAFT_783464 [Geopyxis carbonaria]
MPPLQPPQRPHASPARSIPRSVNFAPPRGIAPEHRGHGRQQQERALLDLPRWKSLPGKRDGSDEHGGHNRTSQDQHTVHQRRTTTAHDASLVDRLMSKTNSAKRVADAGRVAHGATSKRNEKSRHSTRHMHHIHHIHQRRRDGLSDDPEPAMSVHTDSDSDRASSAAIADIGGHKVPPHRRRREWGWRPWQPVPPHTPVHPSTCHTGTEPYPFHPNNIRAPAFGKMLVDLVQVVDEVNGAAGAAKGILEWDRDLTTIRRRLKKVGDGEELAAGAGCGCAEFPRNS